MHDSSFDRTRFSLVDASILSSLVIPCVAGPLGYHFSLLDVEVLEENGLMLDDERGIVADPDNQMAASVTGVYFDFVIRRVVVVRSGVA